MKVIGITGGIGSGKSTVARLLEKYFGAYLIITDDIAKLTMQKGQMGYKKIVEYFGPDILDADLEIDKKQLREIVFDNDEKRIKLNSFTHPFVHEYIINTIKEREKLAKDSIVVIETALFIEAGYESLCDEIWFVTAPLIVRRNRVMQTRGISGKSFDSIVKKQASEEAYRKICTHCIINNGDEESLLEHIKHLLF